MGVMDAADGAGEAVTLSEFKTIAGFTVTPKSCATNGGIKFAKSTNTITPASCDSGDTYYLVAWGR
jgi:hypothetical protein